MPEIVVFITTALSALGTVILSLISYRLGRDTSRAEEKLVWSLRSLEQDKQYELAMTLNSLRKDPENKDVLFKAQSLIETRLSRLSEEEKKRIDGGLHQSSIQGRASYIQKILEKSAKTQDLLHAV